LFYIFELSSFYKTLFSIAAVQLGIQVTYVLSLSEPNVMNWQLYIVFIALSFSIPLLLAATLAALFGFYNELQKLLILGSLFVQYGLLHC
jgi:heme/copper-type cytochrome/quinol oxidase subunit 4